MEVSTRACVAYVAGRAIGGGSGSHVYDHSQSRHYTVGEEVKGMNVNVYDYERRCNFSGTLPPLRLWAELPRQHRYQGQLVLRVRLWKQPSLLGHGQRELRHLIRLWHVAALFV